MTTCTENVKFMMTTPTGFQASQSCRCDILMDNSNEELDCHCTGPKFMDVPSNLGKIAILNIEAAGMEVLKRDSLTPYSKTIKEILMRNLDNFYYFETGVFQNLHELETIYIHRMPKLLKIQPEVFSTNLPKLKFLRIVNTGLEEMPNLNNLNTTHVLHIDLENNQIKRISKGQISRVKAAELLLNYNQLNVVEEEAFYGSEIGKLSLKGNTRLNQLHMKAFAGLQSLLNMVKVLSERDVHASQTFNFLGKIHKRPAIFAVKCSTVKKFYPYDAPTYNGDLSSTAITSLPIDGLREIEILKMQDTKSLTVFPSIYNFKAIKEAYLTYPYHCCAFKFPHTHNPWEFEKHRQFVLQLQETCRSNNVTGSAGPTKELNTTIHENTIHIPSNYDERVAAEEFWGGGEEFFHNETLSVNVHSPVKTAICGNIYRNYHEVKCYPAPDAFNPCEDLMGNWVLRIPVWFISLSAIIGNLFVVIVIATSHFRLTVSKFLMCNLAIADLCIGIHLFLIAVVDACSIGSYFNYAINWQEGNGCNVAGFLTIFGNILSVYTLAVITTERWYTITWAIHLNRRLKLRTAVRVMIAGWICAVFMATLPLLGISSYSKTSICLPLENKGKADAIYLSTLLAFNAITFGLVCVCYGSMYRSIKEGGINCSVTSVRSDLTVAKRMALLVFTDFACWAPIAFFGLTALLGHPLITVTQTKILLVFFYPLNSCANPCLYALLTQQYRRDFFILMGRYGLCKDRAERHKGAIGGKPLPYGSVPQYKRAAGDTIKTNSTFGGNHRESMLTTVVSVEVPISRTNSSSVRLKQDALNNVQEYALKHLNNFSKQNNCYQKHNISTDNM